jgi:hypothetical protein
VSADCVHGFERFILQSVQSGHVKVTFLLKGYFLEFATLAGEGTNRPKACHLRVPLSIRPQPQYQAFHVARQREATEAFQAEYACRADIWGTISHRSLWYTS